VRIINQSTWFVTTLNRKIDHKINSVQLSIPPLTQESILTYKAGTRPFRRNGIRLEPEYWKDKLIIHNYGHGGSGISLSWGSAHISFNILEQELYKGFRCSKKEIAILGSGIIGLTTAHLLADHGWKINVYASQFPPHTTSDIAPGLWNKVAVGGNQTEFQIELLDQVLRESFKIFKILSESSTPKFKGVSLLDVYTFKEDPPIKNLPKGLFPNGIPIIGTFSETLKKKGMLFQSFLVDTVIYIPDLYEKAQTKGIKFNQTTFKTKEDLQHLSQSIIINCTGFGARHLFKDPDLIPICGQLIELKSQARLNYMLAGPMEGNLDNYFIPIHNKIILGGSYEFNVDSNTANLTLCEQILENVRYFFNK
jgi:glycine/D-amino acid oxidase-like deaminating enzyme